MDWGLKQQKFIIHSLDRWGVQDQGTGRSGVWWEPSFWFSDSYRILTWQEDREQVLQSLLLLVQLLSHVWFSVTPWSATCQSSLSFTTSQSLLTFKSIESVMLLTISSSGIPFFSCLQFFPASGSFPVSQLFSSGDQSIGASVSALALPMNTHYPMSTQYLFLQGN